MLSRKCFSLLLFLIGNLLPLKCTQLNITNCDKTIDNNEIVCPNFLNPVYQLTLWERNNVVRITIQCNNNESIWNYDLLPTINITNLQKLQTKFCPFGDDLEELLRILAVSPPKYLEIMYSKQTNNSALLKQYFNGSENLESLNIQGSHLKKLDAKVFEGMENLKFLSLAENHIKDIPSGVFASTPSLSYLDLSRNSLVWKPNFFDNLSNLTHLYLRHLNISNLEAKSLKNLIFLKVLDVSNNKLKGFTAGLFKYLPNLEQINLSLNQIEELPEGLFEDNEELKVVKMAYNPNLTLPNTLFENLTNLKEVVLSNCGLKNMPKNTFRGCYNLSSLYLRENYLNNLSEEVFMSLTNLEVLDLGGNTLKNMNYKVLSPLRNLKILYLDNNLLEYVDDKIFEKMESLEVLHMQVNYIKEIHIDAFKNNGNLKLIQLNNNLLKLPKLIPYGIPFEKCGNLTYLHLKNNRIEKLNESFYMKHLRMLDLSNNNISMLKLSSRIIEHVDNLNVNLNNNSITKIDFNDLEDMNVNLSGLSSLPRYKKKVIYHIAYNPIACNCEAYDLVRYLQNKMTNTLLDLLEIRGDHLYCHHSETLVQKLELSNLTCPVMTLDLCPDKCHCYRRPWDKALVVDCTNLNLLQPPVLIIGGEYTLFNHTELRLERNGITSIDMAKGGYRNVTKLFLSYNKIQDIVSLPNQLEELHINDNLLVTLKDNVLHYFNNSKRLNKISLYNNPLICSCSISMLFDEDLLKKLQPSNLTCFNNGVEVTNLTKDEFCIIHATVYFVLAIIFISMLIIVVLLWGIYYKYQQEIKVWLFARNLLLWWVTEEEVDKDKSYDAFVSFSQADIEFVQNKLLPVLEADPNQYKLCVHYRDWKPGEFIAKQIATSVAESRRTIVVLTPNFLESVWGKMEFRTAHETAMKERRTRLIVILHGDVNHKQDLFDEVKTYLNTRTYIKWGDPIFWTKLKYALPHYNKGNDIKPSKLNQVMKNIEIFDSKIIPAVPNNGICNPIGDSPLVLKKNHLTLDKSENYITPTAT